MINDTDFVQLNSEFPLQLIHTDRDAGKAWKVLRKIDERPRSECSKSVQSYYETLDYLFTTYLENRYSYFRRHPQPDRFVLLALLESSGASLDAVVVGTGIPTNTICDILDGARTLTRLELAAVCGYFGCEPAIFNWTETVGAISKRFRIEKARNGYRLEDVVTRRDCWLGDGTDAGLTVPNGPGGAPMPLSPQVWGFKARWEVVLNADPEATLAKYFSEPAQSPLAVLSTTAEV